MTYHKNCISNLHFLSIHPSIHTSDIPQKLSQTYTNPSIQSQAYTNPFIRPSFLYLKLTLSIHPSIHTSIYASFNPSIHTSDLQQKLSQTYTYLSILPSILPVSHTIHPSVHTSDFPQKTSQTYTIHPSIHQSILLSIHPSYI